MLQPIHPTPINAAQVPPLAERAKAWATRHGVQMYESEEFLQDRVAAFLADGVWNGQPLLIIATPEHRNAMAAALRKTGIDVDALVPMRDVVWLDARDMLALFMKGRTPDADRFEEALSAVIVQVIQNRTYVVIRAFGEMVDLLVQDGNIEGALQLESLWNSLARKYSFNLLCAYRASSFDQDASLAAFRAMCDQHDVVRPTEAYLGRDDAEQLRTVTLLQQQVRALEAELSRQHSAAHALRDTLEHRRRIEEQLRTREHELRDFLENGLEPMHWVAADGTILWANRAELDMLGYNRDEYVGRNIAEFHVDQHVIADMLSRLSRGQELRNHRARLRKRNGDECTVLINSNVFWQDGKFVHTRCFTRDITNLPL